MSNLKTNAKSVDIFHEDMQNRIIEDIKEMDSDALKYLIEHMYPVKAEFNDDCETINIQVDSSETSEDTTLQDIF